MRSWLSIFSLHRIPGKHSRLSEQNLSSHDVIESRMTLLKLRPGLGHTNNIAGVNDIAVTHVEFLPNIADSTHVLMTPDAEVEDA